VKYGTTTSATLERASARETAACVAVGRFARQLLAAAGARIVSHVFAIGPICSPIPSVTFSRRDIGQTRRSTARTPARAG
jgi:chorismate synthase